MLFILPVQKNPTLYWVYFKLRRVPQESIKLSTGETLESLWSAVQHPTRYRAEAVRSVRWQNWAKNPPNPGVLASLKCCTYLTEIKSYSRFPQSWFLMKQWPSRWKFPHLAAILCKKSPSLPLPLENQALSTGEWPWSHLDLMVTWVLGTIPSMQQFPRFFTTFPALLLSCSPWSY